MSYFSMMQKEGLEAFLKDLHFQTSARDRPHTQELHLSPTLETPLGCVKAASGSRTTLCMVVPSTLEPQELFVLVGSSSGRELCLQGTMRDSYIPSMDPSAD